MSEATWHTGDSLTVLETLPDSSVDLIITSPPFLALRSYLPADHPDKANEMGSEATPGLFVDGLMLVVEECRRVLAPHGSLCIELGDTFSGSGGAGGDYNEDGLRDGQPGFKQSTDQGWPLAKSLSLIPQSVWFTMVYGRNPHTGRTTEPWRLRNIVRWCRPNPPVGALGDKYRPATSEMLVACVSGKRFFDLDAVRQPYARPEKIGQSMGYKNDPDYDEGVRSGWTNKVGFVREDRGGAPPLDWWNIPTQPYKGSHYATWPKRLLDIPIRSMCPQRVCRVCGLPSERITETDYEHPSWPSGGSKNGLSRQPERIDQPYSGATVGWSDCGHDDWRNGIVLDPFAGSGTTLEVATGMGRDAIGIDLDERNFDLALQRVGMFLQLAKEPGGDADV